MLGEQRGLAVTGWGDQCDQLVLAVMVKEPQQPGPIKFAGQSLRNQPGRKVTVHAIVTGKVGVAGPVC